MGVPETAGPLIVVSAFFLIVAIIGPFLVPKANPNRGIIQNMIVSACSCCWLFWFCITLAQVNPLFGPAIESDILRITQVQWPPY